MTKLLPILILGVGIIAGLYLLSQQTHLFSKASASPEPQNLKVTNLSNNSFTVIWTTTQRVPGFVTYGTSGLLRMTAQDDRDNSRPNNYFTHHVTLKNLDPETTIFYNINSGGKAFDLKGKPYTQKTAPVITQTPPLPKSIIGKVLNSDNKPAGESIVYLSVSGNQLLSSYTRNNGNWLITLNTARTQDLSSYFDPTPGTQLNITALSGTNSPVSKTVNYSDKNEVITINITSQ